MSIKKELADEMKITRQNFRHVLDSVPEDLYSHPSDNPAWTIGEVLHHITIGLPALQFEIWMIRHARRLFQLGLNGFPSKLFNKINAQFARRNKIPTRRGLAKAYENGHAGIMSSLMRASEGDFQKSVIYPAEFVPELAGEVTVERLFHYVKYHFDIHATQIQEALKESQ